MYIYNGFIEHYILYKVNVKKEVQSELIDVTNSFSDDEADARCAICHCIDPPEQTGRLGDVSVYWLGCDCKQWYHMNCIMIGEAVDFTCSWVGRECLQYQENNKKKSFVGSF